MGSHPGTRNSEKPKRTRDTAVDRPQGRITVEETPGEEHSHVKHRQSKKEKGYPACPLLLL
jgi:hypothetical protein